MSQMSTGYSSRLLLTTSLQVTNFTTLYYIWYSTITGIYTLAAMPSHVYHLCISAILGCRENIHVVIACNYPISTLVREDVVQRKLMKITVTVMMLHKNRQMKGRTMRHLISVYVGKWSCFILVIIRI